MAPVLGSKVSAKRGSAVLEALEPWLQPGEDVRLIVRVNRVNPLIDLLVVTDRRVLGVGSFDLADRGPKLSVDRAQITAFHVKMTLIDPRRLCVTTPREVVSFGNLDRADVVAVQGALRLAPDQAHVSS